jgi:hypothetical protein
VPVVKAPAEGREFTAAARGRNQVMTGADAITASADDQDAGHPPVGWHRSVAALVSR